MIYGSTGCRAHPGPTIGRSSAAITIMYWHSVLCTVLEQADVLGFSTLVLCVRSGFYIRYKHMQYYIGNSLLYSTTDSDLAKIEVDPHLTQKIVNSREQMTSAPRRPIYFLKAERVSFLYMYGSTGCRRHLFPRIHDERRED